jgi:hypothetical protein
VIVLAGQDLAHEIGISLAVAGAAVTVGAIRARCLLWRGEGSHNPGAGIASPIAADDADHVRFVRVFTMLEARHAQTPADILGAPVTAVSRDHAGHDAREVLLALLVSGRGLDDQRGSSGNSPS